MAFRGQELKAILDQQWPDCLVELRDGSNQVVQPAVAARLAGERDYVGVGHHKCIMYLKTRFNQSPHTRRADGPRLPPHVTAAKQDSLEWKQRPDKAASGQTGKFSTLTIPAITPATLLNHWALYTR